ncbi:MAG: hypothetical protein IKW89_04540 [Bacteroidales bacterium]|nr:hypothetical protein [Bacteroidales bacterium]
MSVLDQCMSIIDLTSLDWSDTERYALVGHSFRVMAKAKNYDEVVVGMMHALYAASGYTRSLYDCDVEGDPEWKTALDLFVQPLQMKRFRSQDNIPDEYLLSLNRPRNQTEEECQLWMLGQTVWSDPYADFIRRLGRNRIARNVMVHKLEDMLDVLKNPGKYESESGCQYYLLPWKTHRVVDVRMGDSLIFHARIPSTDDALLLRNPTDEERENLIEKYDRALFKLEMTEDEFPVLDTYSKRAHLENEARFHHWFLSWMDTDRSLSGDCKKEGGDDENDQDLPF